ncbi:MAG: hypothetical protein ABIN67_10225 [Ferruginibacter sp.]
MKRQLLHKILIIFFLFPIYAWAQSGSLTNADITGMWTGALYNDTTQKYLTYEIAITEEKGKLSGYSYTIFDIDGKKETGVKKIKIRWKNDDLILEDLVLISNNYSAPPPKGVRQTSEANLSRSDTVLFLNGTWRTNPTREYSSYTGRLKLQRTANFRPVALYKKLEELKLDGDLSFAKVQIPLQADVAITKAAKEVEPAVEIPVAVKSDPDVAAETITVIQQKVAPAVAALIPPRKVNRSVGAVIKRSTVADRIKDIVISGPPKLEEPIAIIQKKVAPVVATFVLPQKVNRSIGAIIKRSTVADRIKDIVISGPPKLPEPVAINTPPKQLPDIAVAEPSKKEAAVSNPIVKNTTPEKAKPVVPPVIEKKSPPIVKVEEKPKTPPVVVAKETPVKQNPPANEVAKKPTVNPPVAVVKEPAKEVKKPVESVTPPVKTDVAKTEIPQKKDPPVVTPVPAIKAAEKVAERKIVAIQSVFFQSDSLVFTLYDNGEVDGDTVSVIMNGNLIFARQGLTTKANSKTIYTGDQSSDSIMLVMYAENLGSIPPNTGLLVVQDGEATYYVRFTADLQSNAAILLRRKKKE